MKFTDEFENDLYCPKCGFNISLDQYGFEEYRDYEALYPTVDEIRQFYEGCEEERPIEDVYDEVYNELDPE